MKPDAGKKILDVTCGSRTIWFDKHHPNALYCDKRRVYEEKVFGRVPAKRTLDVNPDMICDFTDLPFDDDSFALVVFDPPHLVSLNESALIAKKYGTLKGVDWKTMLRDGFNECMRVLKPDGVLVFKWNEGEIPSSEVWAAIGQKPLFGHHSGKKSQTHWACFMKLGHDNHHD